MEGSNVASFPFTHLCEGSESVIHFIATFENLVGNLASKLCH